MISKEFERLFTAGCESLNILLCHEQTEQFFCYYEHLIEKNKVMNLTAITELPEVITKHFIDSLLLVEVFPDIRSKEFFCIDVGTGAGFPGIPLKIAFPQLQVVLLDSLKKRVGFLDEVISELDLTRISSFHGRAEDFGRDPQYREQFDLCFSRAVANLSTLSEYCVPFIHTGGMFIAYKSGKVDEEINSAKSAVKKLGAKIGHIKSVSLPDTDIERSFVFIEKSEITPSKYPRKAGLPAKEPLR